ncbi:Dabb family protein [Yoonia sp.]|uniref:Dabb family protein n=1 Tax=Yoonia sp. TaxID=2212373 RepID=UPI0035C7A71A
MIRHIVLLDLPDGHNAAELAAIMQGLAELQDNLEGFMGFAHGPNRDIEAMSANCVYAFTCDFVDEATSRIYLDNAQHKTLGARLVALCRGGAKGICVVDMDGTT